MRKISLLIILSIILSSIGCSSSQTESNSEDIIIGKWQNISNPKNCIEITKNNDFITYINGEYLSDVLKEDEKPSKYSYNPLNQKYNFEIIEDSLNNKLYKQGRLEIINDNKIKLSFFKNDSLLISSEFTRLQ